MNQHNRGNLAEGFRLSMLCVDLPARKIHLHVLGMGQMRYPQIGWLILYSRMTTTAYLTHTVHPNVP